MVDIHSHVLPYLDDGSDSLETSVELVSNAVEHGATVIICTPHYRKPYIRSVKSIQEVFARLKEAVAKEGIEVDLKLGEEVYMRPDMIEKLEKGEALTMNDTKCVLIEFDFEVYSSIPMIVELLVDKGYKPIIAHLERYRYADLDMAEEIKKAGGLIQINANSITGRAKKWYYKQVKKLLKANLVDFIASDYHDGRQYTMDETYKFIQKKFGTATAEKLFYTNAARYLDLN